jgi:hypothetical protein
MNQKIENNNFKTHKIERDRERQKREREREREREMKKRREKHREREREREIPFQSHSSLQPGTGKRPEIPLALFGLNPDC